MASYNPPTENLTQFNSGVFQEVAGTSGLTINQGDSRYLRFPIGQGAQTIPSVSITGLASMGSANITGLTTTGSASITGLASMGSANITGLTTTGSANITGATTMTGDIILNKAAGTQSITCSAPTGLNITTNVNSAPINFNVRSTAGTFDNILQVVAATNPRIFINVLETKFNDRTTSTFNTIIANHGGSTQIQNTSTTGTGGIVLDATTSTAGAGAITLKTKDGTPSTTTGLILTGTALTLGTAGGSSGQHLCLTINGTQYKIALLNA